MSEYGFTDTKNVTFK